MIVGRVPSSLALIAIGLFGVQVAVAAPNSNLPSVPGPRQAASVTSTTRSVAPDTLLASMKQLVTGLQKAKLANGMRIVMDLQPDSPTVSVCMTYDVGSRNESPGQSGFAHLF